MTPAGRSGGTATCKVGVPVTSWWFRRGRRAFPGGELAVHVLQQRRFLSAAYDDLLESIRQTAPTVLRMRLTLPCDAVVVSPRRTQARPVRRPRAMSGRPWRSAARAARSQSYSIARNSTCHPPSASSTIEYRACGLPVSTTCG